MQFPRLICLQNIFIAGKMAKLKTGLALLTIVLFCTHASDIDRDDYEVTVQDEGDNYLKENHMAPQDVYREGRILWPYPMNHDKNPEDVKSEENTSAETQSTQEKEDVSEKRFLYDYSYIQSPLIDLMKQSMAINYIPNNPKDLFDYLRDSYPLPKGKMITILLYI